MEIYELTIVLSGKSKAKEKTISGKIEKLIESFKGKLKKADSWGEIELAYKINKDNSGYFLYFELELDKSSVKKFDDRLRTEEDVMRYLLVKKE